jgi:hypothetical protein
MEIALGDDRAFTVAGVFRERWLATHIIHGRSVCPWDEEESDISFHPLG